MVMADTSMGKPARNDAIRATFMPCSASGMAQPRMTSSISFGSSPGAREIASLITSAAKSSGRVARKAPLTALPTGVRIALTMTASRIDHLGTDQYCTCSEFYIGCVRDRKETARGAARCGIHSLEKSQLSAEFDGDQHLHGHRLSVELRRLILPAAQRVKRRLAKQRRT